MGGYFLEYNNFIPADPLKTPAHIAPVWYFTPYYSMLRAITDDRWSTCCACSSALAALLAVLKGRLSRRRGKCVVAGRRAGRRRC